MAYIIIFILIALVLLVIVIALCRVAADSDQQMSELYNEMLTNKEPETDYWKPLTRLIEKEEKYNLKQGEIVNPGTDDECFLPYYGLNNED